MRWGNDRKRERYRSIECLNDGHLKGYYQTQLSFSIHIWPFPTPAGPYNSMGPGRERSRGAWGRIRTIRNKLKWKRIKRKKHSLKGGFFISSQKNFKDSSKVTPQKERGRRWSIKHRRKS